MRGEMWPRRQGDICPPRRKPTALCPVDGPRFAWVPSARAGCHSREEETSLPVRPWSAVDPYARCTPYPGKANKIELGRAFNGHLADHHPILFAHTVGPDRQHRRRYRPTSASRSRRVWPLSCGRRSWTPGSSSPRTWAQRRHHWCSRTRSCIVQREVARRCRIGSVCGRDC
jgi:hypothetical protein